MYIFQSLFFLDSDPAVAEFIENFNKKHGRNPMLLMLWDMIWLTF